MDSDFKLVIESYRNSRSTTGKKIKVTNIKPDGTESNSHYIPLEAVPEYIKAITQLLLEERAD
jgi:hypothetical protein